MATRADERNHVLEQIQVLLTSWSINPQDVATFGVTEDGYFKFVRNAITGRIEINADQDEPRMTRESWPEEFPVELFFELYRTWSSF